MDQSNVNNIEPMGEEQIVLSENEFSIVNQDNSLINPPILTR